MENLDKFFELIERQFAYGGQKYAQTKEKEATDVLFDDFGKNWLFGTMAKYVKRYSNLARERDLLKIATYVFILWLKKGFHIDNKRIAPIDTTVMLKSKYFSIFKERLLEYLKNVEDFREGNESPDGSLNDSNRLLYYIYNDLKTCANTQFSEIAEFGLFVIFDRVYSVWIKDIKNKGTDEDVYNKRSKNDKQTSK